MNRQRGWNRECSGKGWKNYMCKHAKFAASQDYAKGTIPDEVMAKLDAVLRRLGA